MQTHHLEQGASAPGTPRGVTLPAPSRACRRIGLRSRVSARGTLVAALPSQPPRRVGFESNLERSFILLMLARPDVVDLVEQPSRTTYAAPDGRPRTRTLDFLVTLADGRRLAVEVKRAERARATGPRAELARLAAQLDPRLADGVALFTDEHFEPWEAANAATLHEARKRPDPAADAALTAATAQVRGTVAVRDLAALTGLPGPGGRGYRAVVRALFAGTLRAVTRGLLGPASLVAVSEVRP